MRCGVAQPPSAGRISKTLTAEGGGATTRRGTVMLVLTRKTHERIRIGDGVEVTVLAIGRSRVRLGIAGPSDVKISRAEVHQRMQGELEPSAAGDSLLHREEMSRGPA
jgi:carbon storage regulator